jgi:hypothetical protein
VNKPNCVRVLSLNVCGIVSKLRNPDFVEFINNYDIVCLTETKLDFYDNIHIDGYKLLSQVNRVNCKARSGGICVFIHENLSDYVSIEKGRSECSNCVLWFSVDSIFVKKTFFGVVYIPPESSAYSNIDMFNEIETFLMENVDINNDHICLLGDFNAHTGASNDFVDLNKDILDSCNITLEDISNNVLQILEYCNIPISRSSQDVHHIDNYGKRLLQLCSNCNLFFVNGRVGSDQGIGRTTCNKSVIDYAIVSPILFKNIVDFTVLDFDPILSDVHSPISLNLSSLSSTSDSDTSSYNSGDEENNSESIIGLKPRWVGENAVSFIENIDTDQVNVLLDKLENVDPLNIDFDSVNSLINDCNNVITTAADKASMIFEYKRNQGKYSTKSKTSFKKYFNTDCYMKRREYRKAKKHYKKVRNDNNYNNMVIKSKEYKKTLQKQFKDYQKSFISKLRGLRSTDPKAYWSLLNKNCESGKRVINDVAIDTFHEHFKKLNNPEVDPDTQTNFPLNLHEYNSVINQKITEKEVLDAVKTLKNGKACSSDMILNEFLKNSISKLLPVFVKIFNIVFESGIIPDSWAKGIICPIFKNKGDRANPDNYRGITILSCFGKLFTCILNNRLSCYVENYNVLCEEQAGFRKGYGTVDHIFNLKCLIDLYLARSKKLYCAFIDYKKAFDSVNRTLLWQKLLRCNIDGKMLTVLQNLYKNAKSCVRNSTQCSEFFMCNIGVRQGENLSPLLFSLFLNDLTEFMSHAYNGLTDVCKISHLLFDNEDIEVFFKLYLLLYADDTVIFAETAPELQAALNAMYLYCETWNLKVNASKTNVVIFSKSRQSENSVFKYNGENLSNVEEFQYLGIIFSRKGNFQKNKLRLVQQARKAMFSVLSKARKLCLPVDILLQMFDAMVVPILMYGSEVWGYENNSIIESLHLEFCKYIMKVKKCTPNDIVYGELGRVPLSVSIDARMIGFWQRIISGKNTKISRMLYEIMYNLDKEDVFHFKWLSHISSVLSKNGFGNYWDDQFIPKNVCLSRKIKDQCKESFISDWKLNIFSYPKCINYRIYKTNFGLEKYFSLLPSDLVYSLCKFRCISHKLPIEHGRFLNIDRSDRICDLCSVGEIGDEFHYIFNCNFFNDERKKYIPENVYKVKNVNSFFNLFNSEDKFTLIGLSKFCKIVMSVFHS